MLHTIRPGTRFFARDGAREYWFSLRNFSFTPRFSVAALLTASDSKPRGRVPIYHNDDLGFVIYRFIALKVRKMNRHKDWMINQMTDVQSRIQFGSATASSEVFRPTRGEMFIAGELFH